MAQAVDKAIFRAVGKVVVTPASVLARDRGWPGNGERATLRQRPSNGTHEPVPPYSMFQRSGVDAGDCGWIM